MQLILLPLVFPDWHVGFGLLKGRDALKFHFIASDLAAEIQTSGWSQWQLRPRGQLVSGVASVFYALISPAPWTVLPVNAALNGIGAVCVFSILTVITNKKELSLLGSLPFIFFPSNLLWNAQFHNENYAVPGVVLILYGWTVILTQAQEKDGRQYQANIIAILAVAGGSVILGLVRADILFALSNLLLLAVVIVGIILIVKGSPAVSKLFSLILFGLSLAVMFTSFALTYRRDSGIGSWYSGGNELGEETSTNISRAARWESTPGLPGFIDRQFEEIAGDRKRFIKAWAESGSAIDLDVSFTQAGDVFRYLPRGVEIAFLSPFPNLWFSEGKLAAGTATRIVSAFEMIIVYFAYFGLPGFIWTYRKKLAVWVILLICSGMLVVYALTIPNAGALYRFRYPYLMPLVCFGFAGWLQILEKRNQHRLRKVQI